MVEQTNGQTGGQGPEQSANDWEPYVPMFDQKAIVSIYDALLVAGYGRSDATAALRSYFSDLLPSHEEYGHYSRAILDLCSAYDTYIRDWSQQATAVFPRVRCY